MRPAAAGSRTPASGGISGVALRLAVACIAASPALAFEGRIVFDDGAAVADAIVSVRGRAGVSRTDRDGTFRWEPDPAPPFEILVTFPGGADLASFRIERLPAGEPLVLTVPRAPAELVAVTADAAPHVESAPAAAVSLLGRADLEQRHPSRLADVVENIPGMALSGGGHDAVPAIRGLTRGRTLILLDGARVTTERRAGASATFLDPFFLEAVEIARGPGSVAYGSDALGGVLLARTPRAGPGDPLRLRATASLGDGIPQRGAGAELSRGLEEGGWLVQLRYRDFSDYRSPSGDVPNSEASDFGALFNFDHEVGPGALAIGLMTNVGRDVERSTPASDGARISNPREDSDLMTWSYRLDPLDSATLMEFEGYLGRHRLVTEQDRAATATVPREFSISDVEASDAGLRVRATRPIRRARLTGGVDLNARFGLEARGVDPNGREEASIEQADREDLGLYAMGETSLARALNLLAGARLDRVTTRSRGASFGSESTVETAPSGFVALTAGPFHGFQATGQIGRGFRDPTLSDRYFTGVSGRGFVTGNPDLEPERSLQYDLALRYAWRDFRCAAFVYDYRIDGLIERFETGRDPITGRRSFSFRNRGRARLRGVEIEAQAELGRGLRLEAGAQTARGLAEDDSALDDIPSEEVTVLVRKTLKDRADLFARADVTWRDGDPGPNETSTPGYVTFDLGAGWRIGPHLDMRVQVRNLLDREYPSSQDAFAPPAAGRSALLTLVTTMDRAAPGLD